MDRAYMRIGIIAVLVLVVGGVLAARRFDLLPPSNGALNTTSSPAVTGATGTSGLVPVATPTASSSAATSSAGRSGDATGLGLSVPAGFSISIWARNLPGARVMAVDSFGNFWVSQTDQGIVSMIEVDRTTGAAKRAGAVFRNLNKPHGLAFDPKNPSALYIAEEDKVSRVAVYSEQESKQKIADLPAGGGHETRTIGFGPDGRLYVSIGSSCNVCREQDNRRAAILSMSPDGSDIRTVATGLRNAVFFAWQPATGNMWATEMGRDRLGDDVPPDEINIIRPGGNYGWPICYGKNIHDTDFDKNTYIRNPCQEPTELPSLIDIPAHSAPLGLGFVPEGGWPSSYRQNVIVAYHGSWNRTVPTGYKLVRYRLDAAGKVIGNEDFISGWLSPSGKAVGRPVQVLFRPDGNLYVSDDNRGVIYKISYSG